MPNGNAIIYDNENTKNLILLLLSFLVSNLGNGWGTFRPTGAK